MTDAQPTTADEQKTRATHDARGKFAKGNPGGGRPALPQWFRDGGHDSLKTLLAAATGRADKDAPPAAHELAMACSDRVRLDAAKTVIERIYGKAPDEIEVRGDPIAVIRRVIVDVGGQTPMLPEHNEE